MAKHSSIDGSGSSAFGQEAGYGYAQNPIPSAYDAEAAQRYRRDQYGSGGDIPHASYPADNVDYDRYRQAQRSNYGSQGFPSSPEIYPEVARARRRGRLAKRILKVVFGVLLLAVLGGAAYAWWFTDMLDKALAPDEETATSLTGLLSPVADGEPYYVLVMGSDSREGNSSKHEDERGDNERSDVMMLVRVDAKNKKLTLLSIPRDTPYRLPDGSFIKINEVFNEEGIASTIQAVSQLTGLPISHHAEIRVSGLANIVDLLGGVTVDVPIDLSYKTMDKKKVTIKKGVQKLNGEQAEIFARARHEFEDNQDANRQSNVRQLLQAIINEILDRPITEIPGLVLQIASYIDTDFRTLDAIPLALAFTGSGMTVYSTSGPSEGDFNDATGGKWLCYLNPEGWQAVSASVDAGEDPNKAEIDFASTQVLWTEVLDQPDFQSSLAYHYYYGTHLDENGEWVQGDVKEFVNAIASQPDEVESEWQET